MPYSVRAEALDECEELPALWRACTEGIPLPADAHVIGEPVSVEAISYDGNTRRGLTAECRVRDGSRHVVGAAELVFPESSPGAQVLEAYRTWLGLPPVERRAPGVPSHRRHKAEADDVALDCDVELVALALRQATIRCRVLGTEREITLRTTRSWDVVHGEVVTVRPRKRWSYAGHPYLSGEVVEHRIDIPALGLVPLRLTQDGTWRPGKLVGPDGRPHEDWMAAAVEAGERTRYRMERVGPGLLPDEPEVDPLRRAQDLYGEGDRSGARDVLERALAVDVRFLDGHGLLGALELDSFPPLAVRRCEVAVGIGDLSVPADLEGVLPYSVVSNRPFLRCLHGLGQGLWRVGKAEEATAVLERLLRLDPPDELGARFVLSDVRQGKLWERPLR